MTRLNGKVAVVTGAAQGIGLACVQRLLREGAKVAVADRQPWSGSIASTVLNAGPGEFHYAQVDVTQRSQVAAFVAATCHKFGGIDILVANAGIATQTPFLDLTDEAFECGLRTNLFSMFLCGQLVARQMVAQGRGGAIVNMSSVNSVLGLVGYAPYCVSKGGIAQLTRVMSLELAPHGIRVNAVGPGTIVTELTRKTVLGNDQARRMILSRTPLGRLGEPGDVAPIVAFLASDDAAYVTGETVYADGGRLALGYTVPVAELDS